ncbi:hypothetical protein [Plantactinospora sp. BC1]|uniref:hypothetical protein n=1 Tax=Plantactinospora sp. BC1 TaxID=2108470 RepID=UPI001F472224|nr:hypothetical protein [Plantactinospora sp. BC1]
MPDDDRSETAYPAVPSTVRSDDASSSDSTSGAAPRRSPGALRPAPAGLHRLVLLLSALLGHLRPFGAAVTRRLARAAAAVARSARPGALAAARLAGVAAARLRVATGPALAGLRTVGRRLRRAVEPGLARLRRIVAPRLARFRRLPAVRGAEQRVRLAARRVAPPARRLAARTGALAARTGLPDRLGLRRPGRVAVAAGLLCCLGVLAAVEAVSPSAGPAGSGTANAEDRVALSRPDDGTGDRSGDRSAQRSSRSAGHDRSAGARSDEADPDTSSPLDDAAPVAGLTDVQMDNARAIVRTGRDMGMPRRALVIGVATAMQESNLLNRASEVLPESKRYRHQGTGWDHDSVGLFQQRTSSGWGPVNRLMDPAYASARFFEALRQVPGWQRMRLTEAAQAVQYSAYPEHYAKHEGQATRVVDALVPSSRR